MATVSKTLTGLGDRLGFGTSVSVYERRQLLPGSSTPSGSALTSATTDSSSGSVTFTGLTEETDYLAYAVGRSPVQFSTRTQELRPRFLRSMDSGDVPVMGADGVLAGTGEMSNLFLPFADLTRLTGEITLEAIDRRCGAAGTTFDCSDAWDDAIAEIDALGDSATAVLRLLAGNRYYYFSRPPALGFSSSVQMKLDGNLATLVALPGFSEYQFFRNWVASDYGDTVKSFTVTAATPGVFTSTAHGYNNGDQLSILTLTGGTNLETIAVRRRYYVVNKATDTFQLSLTFGGTGVAVAAIGSGTISKDRARKPLTTAIPQYYAAVRDLRLNVKECPAGAAGFAWVHFHESSWVENIAVGNKFNGVTGATGKSAVYMAANNDSAGTFNGAAPLRNVVVRDSGWKSSLELEGGGTDFDVQHFTTASTHSGSVIDASSIRDLTFRDLHLESWVVTTADSDLAICRFEDCRSVAIDGGYFNTSSGITGLNHPLFYAKNSAASGTVTSPIIRSFALGDDLTNSTWTASVPYIKDRAQSTNQRDRFYNQHTSIVEYSGTTFRGQRQDGTSFDEALVVPNTQTGNYTLLRSDSGKSVEVNSASNFTVTVPPLSTTPFPVGTVLEVARIGAGTVTIAPGSGVTIKNRIDTAGTTNRTIASQYGAVSLRCRASDEWVLTGDIL